MGATPEPDSFSKRVSENIQRHGIPIGTDNPALIAAGAFPWPRRFQLQRTEDETGVSGLGYVAWGVVFPDGVCVTRWCVTDIRQTCVWQSLTDVEAIHGHHGKTQIVWLDAPVVEGSAVMGEPDSNRPMDHAEPWRHGPSTPGRS